MKMSTEMRNELEFLQSFYVLTKGRMRSTANLNTVIENFTLEAGKLVKSNQIEQKSLDSFLDEMILDQQVEDAKEAVAKANNKLEELKLKKIQIKKSKAQDTVQRVVDPCSHGRSPC